MNFYSNYIFLYGQFSLKSYFSNVFLISTLQSNCKTNGDCNSDSCCVPLHKFGIMGRRDAMETENDTLLIGTVKFKGTFGKDREL